MPFTNIAAEKLYTNDNNLKKEDVKILQEWLNKQPHLPQIEEFQLLIFLHGYYYSIEATKAAIDKYFSAHTHHPRVFSHLPEDLFKICASVASVNVLPQSSPKDDAVLFCKLLDFKTDNFNFLNLIRYVHMIACLWLHQHGYAWGAALVIDMKGTSLGHLARVDLMGIKQIADFVQTAAPIRLKGIHIINGLSFIDNVKAIVKPFLSTELYNMIQFHSSLEKLYKHVPQEILPEEYGGTSPTSQKMTDENVANVMRNFEFFPWHDNQVVNESKRLDKDKKMGENFGVDGSFRKLAID